MTNSQLDLYIIALEAALSSADDNVAFLKALDTVEGTADTAAIPHLLLMLNDDHEYQEWMWSIMHVAEALGQDDSIYTKHLVPALTKLLDRSPEWANTLLLRVLNNDASLQELLRSMPRSTDAEKIAVRQIARALIDEDPQRFERSGNLVLNTIQLI